MTTTAVHGQPEKLNIYIGIIYYAVRLRINAFCRENTAFNLFYCDLFVVFIPGPRSEKFVSVTKIVRKTVARTRQKYDE